MKDLTVNNNTRASNPGNSALKPLIWFKHDAKRILLLGVPMIVFLALGKLVSEYFLIAGIPLALANIWYWKRQQEHFKSGDSNGGLVISTNPSLLAVYTGLGKGYGYFPVVKIIRLRSDASLKINHRIPTVALYTAFRDDSIPHWANFNPVPLTYATNNKKEIDAALNSYNDEYWQNLNDGLALIPKPYKPGIYPVMLEENTWNDGEPDVVGS